MVCAQAGLVFQEARHWPDEIREAGGVAAVQCHAVGDFEQRHVPCRADAVVVAPSASGDDDGHLAAVTLGVAEGFQELSVWCDGMVVVEPGFAGQAGIACPAVFFALWAIRGEPDEISSVGVAA